MITEKVFQAGNATLKLNVEPGRIQMQLTDADDGTKLYFPLSKSSAINMCLFLKDAVDAWTEAPVLENEE